MKQSESIISTERLSSDSDAVFANDLDFAEIGFEDSQNDGQDDSHEKRTFICDTHVHGKRLDAALVQLVDEFSRSYLQQLIERGSATINSQVVHKAATKIKAGDTLSIVLHATPQSQAFKPEAMDIEIVYEDAHLMVINKPAGLVVHPAPGNWSGTLLNGLLHRDKSAILLPRAGIVHRLDKDTSGLMVVARSRQAMDTLVKKIADREVNRQYVALAHKAWVGAKSVEVDQAIGRDPRNRLQGSGRPCQNGWQIGQNHCHLATKCGRSLFGAMPIAYRKNPSNTGAYGVFRASLGGGYGLWRGATRRAKAASAACEPFGF